MKRHAIQRKRVIKRENEKKREGKRVKLVLRERRKAWLNSQIIVSLQQCIRLLPQKFLALQSIVFEI